MMRRITVGQYLAMNINSLANVDNIPFLQMPTRVSFKKYKAQHLKETCNHSDL